MHLRVVGYRNTDSDCLHAAPDDDDDPLCCKIKDAPNRIIVTAVPLSQVECMRCRSKLDALH